MTVRAEGETQDEALDGEGPSLTVDQLAAAFGTTTRHVRSLQTLGLLPRPELRGRTGLYGPAHRDRLAAVLRLQDQGFSLESLRILFHAHTEGRSLASVLGLPARSSGADAGDLDPDRSRSRSGTGSGSGSGSGSHEVHEAPLEDAAALYGFAELQPPSVGRHRGRGHPLLSVVPTTVWDESQAS
ncbi:MAG TPA: MerR family transcriptional regulator [Acidimicrobiales bacterium]|nr:MerR family transcriptional regulator [Acidimicrobiales bacterium]